MDIILYGVIAYISIGIAIGSILGYLDFRADDEYQNLGDAARVISGSIFMGAVIGIPFVILLPISNGLGKIAAIKIKKPVAVALKTTKEPDFYDNIMEELNRL